MATKILQSLCEVCIIINIIISIKIQIFLIYLYLFRLLEETK